MKCFTTECTPLRTLADRSNGPFHSVYFADLHVSDGLGCGALISRWLLDLFSKRSWAVGGPGRTHRRYFGETAVARTPSVPHPWTTCGSILAVPCLDPVAGFCVNKSGKRGVCTARPGPLHRGSSDHSEQGWAWWKGGAGDQMRTNTPSPVRLLLPKGCASLSVRLPV